MEAIASRLEASATISKKLLAWRPSPLGWRPSLLVARSFLSASGPSGGEHGGRMRPSYEGSRPGPYLAGHCSLQWIGRVYGRLVRFFGRHKARLKRLNKKLLDTSALLIVTSALLVVTSGKGFKGWREAFQSFLSSQAAIGLTPSKFVRLLWWRSCKRPLSGWRLPAPMKSRLNA